MSALPDMLIMKEELTYRTNVKDIISKLEAAISCKNLSCIKLYLQQGETLHVEWGSELFSKAVETTERLEEIQRHIEQAEETKIQEDLELAVQMCIEFDYTNEEVERVTQLRDTIIMFNKETALALNICDLDALQRQLQIAKVMGLQSNPLVGEIKQILFESSELLQRHFQYMFALQLGDIAMITDRHIGFLDAKLMSNKALYDWKKYRGLKDPTAWASSKWTRRSERAAGFYRHTKEKLHESLTKLNTKLNEKALECFTSIRIVMGDMIASNPMIEAKDLLVKVYKNPKLIEEVYLQLMKQLTGNSNPSSVTKGWRLFAMCLRTFTSQKLEDFIFVFIRQNSINSLPLLRLLFYSIVAQQPKKPNLEYVQSLFE